MLRIAPGMGSHGGSRDPSRRSFPDTSAGALGGFALASALGLAPRRARAATTMSYAFWGWGSEIVEADAKLFEEEYGEAINLQPIPGDFVAVLETDFRQISPSTFIAPSVGKRPCGTGRMDPTDRRSARSRNIPPKRNFRALERTRGRGLTASGLGSPITTEDPSAYSATRRFSALPATPQPLIRPTILRLGTTFTSKL